MSKSLRLAVLLVLGTLALAGCSLFGKKSGYEDSRANAPLEIPPDLDSPSTSGALEIPETGGTAAETGGTGATPGTAAAPANYAPQAVVAGDESSLNLADAPAGAWRRIGLALQRSGVGELVSSDEAAGTYTLKTETVERKGGMFSKMFNKDKATTVVATRVVRVAAAGEGSTVTVEDEDGKVVEDEAARRVIAALKQRLG